MNELWSYYSDSDELACEDSELVPWLNETHKPTGLIGDSAPYLQAAIPVEHVKRTLLFAHRVAVGDPLLGIQFVPPLLNDRHAEYARHDFIHAIAFWICLHSFISDGILLVVPPPLLRAQSVIPGLGGPALDYRGRALLGPPYSQLADEILDDALRDDGFLRDLAGLFPEVNRDNILVELLSGELGATIADLQSARAGRELGSRLGFWAPSKRHVELTLALLSRSAMTPLGLAMVNADVFVHMIELPMPSVAPLNIQDVLSLRRQSDIFDEWRDTLSDVLIQTDALADRGLREKDQLGELTSAMTRIAGRLAKEIQIAKKDAVWSAVRSMSFGTIGAGVGASIGGLAGALGGLAAGAIEAVFDIAKDGTVIPQKLRAQHSSRRHALMLAGTPMKEPGGKLDQWLLTPNVGEQTRESG